jgi:hypothetical protein
VLAAPPMLPRLFARVLSAARGLPGEVEVAQRYDGATVLKHDGRFMAGPAMHVSAEPNSLVVKVSREDRDLWLEEAGEIYYVTDFYRPHPVVLVRLELVDDDILTALLQAAWRATAPASRVRRVKDSRVDDASSQE